MSVGAAASQPSLARKLVDEVVLAPSSRFTSRMIAAAQERVLDTVGVGLAGMVTPVGRSMARFAREGGAAAPNTGTLLWGSSEEIALEKAVLANGTAAHALDYDDTNTHAILHAGATVVPLALGLAKRERASGLEMLQAIICGYQVAAFLGKQVAGTFPRAGFSGSAICNHIGAAAVAARLCKLDAAQAVSAFGIVGSLASGINEYLLSGGDTKPVHLGWAAQAGIQAALMARAGIGGPPTVLEGDYGVFKSFARTSLPSDVLSQDVWADEEILLVSPKPYPVCHGIHPTADAWLELLPEMRAAGVDPSNDLESITCLITRTTANFSMEPLAVKRRPATAHQARFSFPWVLGRLALDGELKLASFDEALVQDPQLHSFMDKVGWEMVESDAYPRKIPGGVRAVAKDGRIFEKRKQEQRGGPTNPFTSGQLETKFLDSANGCGTPQELAAVISAARSLGNAQDVDSLIKALGALRTAV